jgi:hypothetical protein
MILREMDEAITRAAAAEKDAEAAALAEAEAARAAERDAAAREQAAREAATRQAAEEARRAEETERVRAHEEAEAHRRAEHDAAERARREAEEEAARKETERRRARQAELADDAVKTAAVDDLAAARRQFTLIRREWSAMGHAESTDADVAARYAEADAAFAARDAAGARRGAAPAARGADAASAARRTTRTAGGADRSHAEGRRACAERSAHRARHDSPAAVQARLRRDRPPAQGGADRAVAEAAGAARYRRLAALGERRHSGAALREDGSAQSARRSRSHQPQVRDLQQRWREAADVPRAQGELLWRRFKAAHDEAWAKCESYFAEQAEARAANLAKKTALSERAEALAESTHWIQTAEEIKKLQAEWKTIGPVTRGQEKAVWERFRAACDRFFSRRHADLAERKVAWAENLAKKEALCVKAKHSPNRPTGNRPRPICDGCRPNGNRSDRSRRHAPRRSGSASAPPAIGSSRDTPSATTSPARNASPRVKPSSPSSKA